MATPTSQPARIELPEVLGLTAAAPLADRLRALSGSPLALDASKVERLGGLCLQVLLSARLSWRRDAVPFDVVDPSPAFLQAWSLFGAPALSSAE